MISAVERDFLLKPLPSSPSPKKRPSTAYSRCLSPSLTYFSFCHSPNPPQKKTGEGREQMPGRYQAEKRTTGKETKATKKKYLKLAATGQERTDADVFRQRQCSLLLLLSCSHYERKGRKCQSGEASALSRGLPLKHSLTSSQGPL